MAQVGWIRCSSPVRASNALQGTRSEEQDESGRAWLPAALAFALALTLVLRLANAAFASLHLDDFHSLHHARAVNLNAFFGGLLEDNHPPLSFLILRTVRAVLGESELALRLPGCAYALGTVWLVWRMARRLPDTCGRAAAVLVIAVSSLHLETTTDLRMYGLLALAVAGFLDASIDLLEDGRGRWRVVLWALVGLHTHYHFLHVLFVLGVPVLVMLVFVDDYRRRLRAFLAAALVVGVAYLPWAVLGLRHQLSHELLPGGSEVSRTLLAEGMLHLVFLNLGLGGPLVRTVFLAGGATLVAATMFSGWRLVRPAPHRVPAPAGVLWFAGAWLLPAWTALAAAVFTRAGFEWRYLVGALPPFALLVGAAIGPGRLASTRRLIVALALAAATWLCVLNVLDPGRENYKDAVRRILELSGQDDAVLAADWSPRIFPHGLAWSYYAPRLLAPGQQLPQRLEHTDEFDLLTGAALSSHPRVFALLRSIPEGTAMIDRLRAEFDIEETQIPGAAIYLIVYERSE